MNKKLSTVNQITVYSRTAAAVEISIQTPQRFSDERSHLLQSQPHIAR